MADAAFPTRLGEPDMTYAVPFDDGRQVAITTDASGRVTPVSQDEVAVADHHGLATEAPTKARRAKSSDSGPVEPAEEA